MADDLLLYTNPMSRGRIARWMLEEVGQPYRIEIVAWDAPKPNGLLAANPMGKLPTLIHGTAVVTEAAAICAYLADAFPEAGLVPPPGGARADYHRWLFFAAGPLEAAITNRSLGVDTAGKEGMVGYGSYDLAIDALEQAVTGRAFVAGDRFTAADVYVGSQVNWGLQFASIPDRPAFRAYWEALARRPAFQRAAALDDALIAAAR